MQQRLSTGFSTAVDSVDESCGYPVDGVDNFAQTRNFPAFFACQAVDNPVEAVDEYFFGDSFGGSSAVNTACSTPFSASENE